MFKIKIELDYDNSEFYKKIDDLVINTPNDLKKVVSDTANDIANSAKSNIKVNSYKTGALYNSVNITNTGYEAIIKADAKHAPYIELGTKPHMIYPKSASVLKFNIKGKTVFSSKVRHPGTKAKPFLKPAVDENTEKFIKRIEEVLNK